MESQTHDATITKCKSLLSRASFFAHLSKNNPAKEQVFWKTACDFIARASIVSKECTECTNKTTCLNSLNNFERKMLTTGIPLIVPVSFFESGDSAKENEPLTTLDNTLHDTDDHDHYVASKRMERELVECRRELAKTKASVAILTEREERYEQRIEELNERVASMRQEKEKLCAQLEERNEEIGSVIETKLSTLKEKLNKYMTENAQLHDELVAARHFEEQVYTLKEEARLVAAVTARKISSYENRLGEHQDELESLQRETQSYKDLLYKLGSTLTDEQSAIIVAEMEKNGEGNESE